MMTNKEIAEVVADAFTDSMADYRAHINELKQAYIAYKTIEHLIRLDDIDLNEAEDNE